MAEIHEGGCLCGAVRYRAKGAPTAAFACHCTFCQKSTGTALRVPVGFLKENVEFTGGLLSSYDHRSTDHGRILTLQFCPRCGTNVGLTTERFPAVQLISSGTFDDRSWFKIGTHIFTRSAVEWMAFPPGITCFARHRVTEDGTAEAPLPSQTTPWLKSDLLP
jgi:hypothetical protein